MISFFKNKEKYEVNDDKSYCNIAALLIHAAKIDENYEEVEKEIIKKTLIELGAASSTIDKHNFGCNQLLRKIQTKY